MYLVVCLDVSEFMTAFWASLLSLGVLDRINSVNVEDNFTTLVVCFFRQNHEHPTYHTVSHFSKCFLVLSYLLDHCHSVSNTRTRLWNHVCCYHILLKPLNSQMMHCRFHSAIHHVSRGTDPLEKSERVAKYIIHLQLPVSHYLMINDYLLPYNSLYFHLLWEITKCFQLTFCHFVVEFHLRWVRLKPVLI